MLAFANPIYDAANKVKLGSDNGSCIRTAVGKAFECSWTTTLAGGSLVVSGPFYDTKDSVLAVTGGTGKWAHAHGEMRLHARNAKGTAYDFAFSVRPDRVVHLRRPRAAVGRQLRESEGEQHPGVAQRVGLDVFELEEFGHAGVIRPAHRLVRFGIDGGTLDLDEAVAGEERGLERQREQPGEPELARLGDQRGEDPSP